MNLENIELGISSLDSEEKIYRFDDLRDVLASDQDLKFQSPVYGEIKLYKNKEEVYLYGALKASVILPCSRCLKEAEWHISKEFSYRLKPMSLDDIFSDKAFSEDDVDIDSYDGETIDVSKMFSEQIRLDIPVRFLCSAGCRGLCPGCGCDLNFETCKCVKEDDVSRPFAGLGQKLLLKS